MDVWTTTGSIATKASLELFLRFVRVYLFVGSLLRFYICFIYREVYCLYIPVTTLYVNRFTSSVQQKGGC